MSNRPFIDPRLIDWTNGLNPLCRRNLRDRTNRFVFESLQEPLTVALRESPGLVRAYAAPDATHAILPAGTSPYELAIAAAPMTWLIGAAAWSQQAEGFLAQVTWPDGSTLYSQPIHSANVTGQPAFLSMPVAILPPDQPVIRLINLSASPNRCQFVLYLIHEAK